MKVQIATSLAIVLIVATASFAQQVVNYAPPNQFDNAAYVNVPAPGYEAAYDPNCNCESCMAQSGSGRYVSMFGGWTGLNDVGTNFTFTDQNFQSQSFDIDVAADGGWCAGGSIGRQLGQRFRTDLEFAYRNNSFESATISDPQGPLVNFDVDGSLTMYSSMANLFFDFRNCNSCGFTPYVGGGAGFAFLESSIQPTGIPLAVEMSSSAFAYQLIAGASMPVSQRAQLFAEYRLFGTGDYSMDMLSPFGSLGISGDVLSHNVVGGLRINIR